MGTTQTAVLPQEPSYVARMSVRGIGCKPEGGEHPKLLCQIYGRAVGTKSGEDKIHDGRVWTCLSGQFAAINLETGEEFRSARLFLPEGIQEVIENAVKEIKVSDGEEKLGLHVEFGLELYSIRAANPAGYTYKAKNILPTEKRDELTELQKAIRAAKDAKRVAQLSEAPAQPLMVQHVETQSNKKK